MREKKRFLVLILIMTAVASGTAGITLYALYQVAFLEERERLVETAQSQARLMEAIARHDSKYAPVTQGKAGFPDSFSATLSQIKAAHATFKGFGRTGEFTLAKREGEQIVFLLSHRHFDLEDPRPVPFDSKIAEPMRRALSGKSGTVIGLDYRGVQVLAAHEPVQELNLGIVAKIDMEEVREPFVRAGLLTGGIGVVLILLGTVSFLRVSNPIIQRLEENERRYRGLFESAADTLLMIDVDGTIIDANPAACNTYGCAKEQLISRNVEGLLSPDQRPMFKAAAQIVSEGKSFSAETEQVRMDGTVFAAEVRISPLMHNGKPVIIAATRDVTERKRTEQDLQWELSVSNAIAELSRAVISPDTTMIDTAKTTLRYAKLLTNSDDGFVSSIDPETGESVGHSLSNMMTGLCQITEGGDEGRIVFPRAADGRYPGLWGHSLNTREAFYTNSPDTLAAPTGVPEGHVPVRSFLTVPAVVGEQLMGQVALANARSPYTDRDLEAVRRITRLYAVALDVKRYEQEIRKLNAELERRVDERTSQLRTLASELTSTEQRERRRLAQLLHDHLQQLIVGAKIHIDLLRRRVHDQELRSSFDNVNRLLAESINASRSLTFELSPPILFDVGLAAALGWVARQMTDKHGLIVEVDAASEVRADTEGVCAIMLQAVREALFNVVKHAEVNCAKVRMSTTDGGHVRIEVRDEGIGFDLEQLSGEEDRPRGFGLFSIRERIDLMGGRLEIESAKGRGTILTISAPIPRRKWEREEEHQSHFPIELTSPQAEPVSIDASRPVDGSRQIRVLLADDHKIMLEGLSRMLQNEPDIEIVGEARDGQMAMDQALSVRPDVVIMDVSMPKLNGVEATRRIRADLPGVQVIGLSMYQTADRADAMREAGAIAYLNKDGPSSVLLETIRACRLGRTDG